MGCLCAQRATTSTRETTGPRMMQEALSNAGTQKGPHRLLMNVVLVEVLVHEQP